MDGLPQGRFGKSNAACSGREAACDALSQDEERAADGGRMARLARAIEEEIIPRLMLAHRTVQACPLPPASEGRTISEADVREFAKMVLSHDESVALACIETMRARGTSIEVIYLGLLAPTARYLGDLWSQDLCDFMDVTAALGRLQHLLRSLSASFESPVEPTADGRRLLLSAAPGEQHTFGLAVVGEFFRRAGWDVAGGPWDASGQTPGFVATEWFDMVGFSLAAEVHADALRGCIEEVRHASMNPDIGIMVGGPIFIMRPDLLAGVHADLVATDGREAPVIADRWLACRGARRQGPQVVVDAPARLENEKDATGRTGVLRS